MTRSPRDDARPRVAVLQLPGVNCEYETCRALAAAGLTAELVRWNRPESDLAGMDAFVLPGGFSYEDRIRAGAVAAKAPVLDVVGRAAQAGAPVLGLCNGAQVLVEAGLVPGLRPGHVEMALAANAGGWAGYYCSWVYLAVIKDGRETAFTSRFEEGEVLPVPMAHAQGCFTMRDRDAFQALVDAGQVPLRYVSPDGDQDPDFPWNPNGSLRGAAGVTNPAGNVLALMPHPERGARLRQVPETLSGIWGRARRDAAGDRARLEGPGPGAKLFQSLADYLAWEGRGTAAP